MTAAEEIEAAIVKLTVLKAESTPKPWHDWEDDLTNEVDLWHDQEQRLHIATIGVAGMPRVEADADLIVTLHRTIDAQLGILWHVAEHYRGDLGIGTNRHVVALARAINGVLS